MDFERKFDFFKTHKKSYTESLCIIDVENGRNNQYIWSFGQFLPQTSDFR
jgi:hypothetical protein